MPTDALLMAALQTLWRAATPAIVPPAVSTAAPPDPAPVTPPGEVTDQDSAEHCGIGTADDWAELQADIMGGILDGIEGGIEGAIDAGLLDADEPAGEDPFDSLDDAEREHLLSRHRHPEPCGFCGGRHRHNPQCVALCDEWAVAMPFGRYKGKPVRSLDRDYLAWIRKSGMAITSEVADEIDRVLDQRQGA